MATLTVGTGQQYATIAAAVNATKDGDVVLVQAGVYLNDFVTTYHKITLQSVGGLAIMQATQAPPNGKAILTTETDITVNGFGFTGAFDGDVNGAGIRYEGGNLVVKNSVFWNDQDGILGNSDLNGTILIQNSEFSHNGAGDGYSHGIYINAIKSLTVENSYFHDAQVGHEIKSRALATTLTGNRIFDNTIGNGSYSVDLPDGGTAVLANNIIEKGPNTENVFTVHFGGEGTPYAGSSLAMTGNTFVNDRTDGSLLLNQTGVTATLSGNSIYGYGAGQIANGAVAASGNTTLAARPTLDTSSLAPTLSPSAPPAGPPPAPDLSPGTVLQNWGVAGAVVASGHVLTVGAAGQFHNLASALAASVDGDTIQVAAGTYVNDFGTINHKVIIEGVGGVAKFVQSSVYSYRDQGMFTVNADATIRNVELSGGHNYRGYEAGLWVNAGNVTLVNSTIDHNEIGVFAVDNAATNLAIYNSEIGPNSNVNKGTNNIQVGAINSLTMQGDYVHGGSTGHELSDRAFNSDIEHNRFIDGADVAASFLLDLGAGGKAVIRDNLLVKGAQAANGVLVHIGGEAKTYANSDVTISNNTLVSQYLNAGHPYTYFIVADSAQPLASVTTSNNLFQGGVPGGRWLTNAFDAGGNAATTGTPVDTLSRIVADAVTPMFAPPSGKDVLTLVLSEEFSDNDAQFYVTVDGVGAGGGTVTAAHGTASQSFSFAGTWAPGAHTVAVTLLNSQTGNRGGAGALWVGSVSLDGSMASPGVRLWQSTYTTTLTSSASMPGFDAEYYLAHNPDVAAAHVDPLQHYLTFGWHEGRNPSAGFDTNFYLTQNPDVKAAGINPLEHYDQNGWKEGRTPSLAFADTQPGVSGVNSLDQYLTQGRWGGTAPVASGGTMAADPLVDAAYYDRQLGATILPTGLAAAQQAAWSYDTSGWQKGLNPNAFFDTNYYLSHNPDVAAAHIDPLLHYETYGWKEGRDPSAQFSTTKYLAAYSDVKAAGIDPLMHYLAYGQTEGRLSFQA